jgi:predicted GTPase
LKIAGYVDERRKSLVIVLNKWDLAKKEGKTRKEVEKEVYQTIYLSIKFWLVDSEFILSYKQMSR